MMERIRCLKHVNAIFLIMVLLLLLHINPSLCHRIDANVTMMKMRCIERERKALLAFKHGLVDVANGSLSSWAAGTQAQNNDCCRWERIECDNQTGHVIKLDLGGQSLQGTISPKLMKLRHLEYLDLSDIAFNNGTQIPELLGSQLRNLRYLDLSWASFGGQIPYQLGNLTRLQYLDLTGNNFTLVESLNWVPHLPCLEDLYLSHVNLSLVYDWSEKVSQLPNLRSLKLVGCDLPPPILSSTLNSHINYSQSLANVDLYDNHALTSSIFKWLCNFKLTSLAHLELSSTNLSGPIPDVFENMSSLARLGLSSNNLEGRIPPSFGKLCRLEGLWLNNNSLSGQFSDFVQILSTCTPNSLETLSLSRNNLTGSFPNLTNFLSLKSLYLDENRLSGRIPESLGQLSKLEYIDLSGNSLSGVITENHFSLLSKLWDLHLSSNSLVFNVSSDWIPPFQLDSILLRSCKIGPNFPKWLGTQNTIELDISDAGISDTIPSWFLDILSLDLLFMNISHNQIRGTLANLTFEFPYFSPKLDFSSNQLEGPIPSSLSQASYLDLSNNMFSGPTSFMCAPAIRNLFFLNLSSNHLSGELPDCWTHLENLVFLDLSNNNVSGKIPTTIGSLYQMQTLKLRRNRFVGDLPSSLKNCSNLEVIDVGENELSRSIPEWIGVRLPNLVILMLQSNHFSGSLSSQLCYLAHIQILDFSVNNISGSIPKCINNLTTLAQINGNSTPTITHSYTKPDDTNPLTPFDSYEDDATFMWKGIMYSYKNTLGLVKRIDLSSNRLTGEIPSEITHLVGLVSLNLSKNHLTGQIPPEIGKLQSLEALDLSRNQIDGRIPTSLSRIDRLPVLDLSYNNLSGEIPKGTQLQGFDPSVYAGNAQLCGPPLQKMCADPDHQTGPDQTTVFGNQEDKEDGVITKGFYISMAVGFVVGFWGVCGSLIFIRSWRYTYCNFLNVLNDWLYVRVVLIKRRLRDA